MGERGPDSVRNVNSGDADTVVQAGRVEGDVNVQKADASGEARIYQAAGNQYIERHLHFGSSTQRVRRVETDGVAEVCPYPDMAPFTPEDAEWFFGRDRLCAHLLERVDQKFQHGGGPLIVVAPSGSGKSSLLQAGLIPRLAEGSLPGSQRWPATLITPTGRPIVELATAIAGMTGERLERVEEQAKNDPARLIETLRAHVHAGAGSNARLIVVVDQLEELFTLCGDEQERRQFLDLLARLASTGPDGAPPVALLVYGLRSDFYTQSMNYPQLGAALENDQVLVGPMSASEVREAIVHPAERVDVRVDPGLVDLLLRDLGVVGDATGGDYEAGRLPLLAHALRATWRERHGRTLAVDAYRLTGGIEHAVATTADRVYDRLDPDQKRIARVLFLRLIRIGEGSEDTRRRLSRTELLGDSNEQVMESVLNAFTRARLLTQGRETVEITHEILLRAWPLLRNWISDDRTGNLLRQQLHEDALAWDNETRDPAALYRGTRLETARERTAPPHYADLSPTTREFLDASIRDEDQRAQRRRRLRTSLLALTALSLIATVVALWQLTSANQERDNAIFSQVTGDAGRLRGDDPPAKDLSLAAQLSLVADDFRQDDPAVQTDLIRTESTPLAARLVDHIGPVNSAAFSPDGATLASAGEDRVVRLWDVRDPARPRQIGTTSEHSDHIRSVTFSPDGKRLASAGDGGTVRLWNVRNPARPREIGPPIDDNAATIYSLAFSPDGATLASAGEDQTVRLWDVRNPAQPNQLVTTLREHTEPVYAVAFSPDGRTLASAGLDESVRVWDVLDRRQPKQIAFLEEPTKAVNTVAFSPDSRTLAAGSDDAGIFLWDVRDPMHPRTTASPLKGHSNRVYSVGFSADSTTLASASTDRTVRLWDLRNPNQARPINPPLTGHTQAVNSVVFSSDGMAVASASADHTVRLWNLPTTRLTEHSGVVWWAAFSPDNETLASAGDDEAVLLWDVSDPARPKRIGPPLTGHHGRVFSVAFSPNSRTLAAGGDDAGVFLWDVSDPAHPGPRVPLDSYGGIYSVAFSPDNNMLATASRGGAVRLWDVSDPARPRKLDSFGYGSKAANSVAFSPDSRTLAVGGDDGPVELWDLRDPTNAEEFDLSLTGHTQPVKSVAFSQDGLTVAAGGQDGTVRMWDVRNPDQPRSLGSPLTGHTQPVNSIAFSPDNISLATASADQTVRLWDVHDPSRPRAIGSPLTGPADEVTSVSYSRNNRALAYTSKDGTTQLMRLQPDKGIRERICASTNNILTPDTWRQYVSDRMQFDPPCADS